MTVASLILASVIAALHFANPFGEMFDSLAHGIGVGLDWINGWTHNYGWSMLGLALIVRLALMPLFLQQYRSMKEMQAVAPYVKRLQNRYAGKKDPANQRKLQEETMQLYKEHGVNPLGGCLPALAQMPILFAVYRAIWLHNDQFKHGTWAWIGSSLSHQFPQVFATNLFEPDKLLMAAYAVSMYFSMKLTPTSGDPQQQQMLRTQTILMPVMFFGLGLIYKWSSAFVLYWLGFNLVSMVQQWVIMRAPSRISAPPAETPATLAGYPLECPSCHQQLVVVKGSKCEKCGAKVRKLVRPGNGAVGSEASGGLQAPTDGKTTGGGATKPS